MGQENTEEGLVILKKKGSVKEVPISELLDQIYHLRVGNYENVICIRSNLTTEEVAEYRRMYRD